MTKPVYSRFFIIKSYTEEDVHKAIKYQIWSSTDKGNKVLDEAYMDLQDLKNQVSEDLDKDTKKAIADADVHLLFSVN